MPFLHQTSGHMAANGHIVTHAWQSSIEKKLVVISTSEHILTYVFSKEIQVSDKHISAHGHKFTHAWQKTEKNLQWIQLVDKCWHMGTYRHMFWQMPSVHQTSGHIGANGHILTHNWQSIEKIMKGSNSGHILTYGHIMTNGLSYAICALNQWSHECKWTHTKT